MGIVSAMMQVGAAIKHAVAALFKVTHSLRFDGTNDYLRSGPVAASNRKTVTFSAWVRLAGHKNYNYFLSTYYGATTFQQAIFYVDQSGSVGIFHDYDGDLKGCYGTADNLLTVGQWHHVVVAVDTTNGINMATVWVDGLERSIANGGLTATAHGFGKAFDVSQNTAWNIGTWAGTSTAQTYVLGGRISDHSSSYIPDYILNGQLAEVHFIDGQALTAADFGETRNGQWVPKEVTGVTYGTNGFYLPFDRRTEGVTLLLDGDGTNGQNTFTDKSSASQTITINGNTQVDTTTKKFGTGSIKFDGTGDYLAVSNNTSLDLGTGDFTIEMWVNLTTTSGNQYFCDLGTNGIALIYDSGFRVYVGQDGADATYNTTTTFTAGTWYHVALVRDGSTKRVFVDGSQVSSATNTNLNSTGQDLTIGAYGSRTQNWTNGYIDDFRVTKGIARDIAADWTAGVYNSPLTNDIQFGSLGRDATTDGKGVSLLIRGDTMTDLSGNQTLSPQNGATAANGTYKYSTGGSLFFDGSDDYIDLGYVDVLDVAGGDWTIECWIRPGNVSNYRVIASYGGSAASWATNGGQEWVLMFGLTHAYFQINNGGGGVTNITAAHGMNNAGNWYHIAATRSDGTIRLFVNGSQIASSSATPAVVNYPKKTVLGDTPSGGSPYSGYIEDFRVTQGIARDIASGFSGGAPISGGGWDVSLTNDETWDKPKNNFEVNGGITPDDQLIDTPNLRFATLDPSTVPSGTTLSNGNLTADFGATDGFAISTQTMSSGKYYFEVRCDASPVYAGAMLVGVCDASGSQLSTFYGYDGTKRPPAGTSYGTLISNGDVVGVALDADSGTTWFTDGSGNWQKNATAAGIAAGSDTNYAHTGLTGPFTFGVGDASTSDLNIEVTSNFGQDHTFAGSLSPLTSPYTDDDGNGEFYYAPPAGFKALATSY